MHTTRLDVGKFREIRVVQILRRHLDRMGLEHLIMDEPDMVQVGSCTSLGAGRELCYRLQPEVVIISADFPCEESLYVAKLVLRQGVVQGVVLLDDELSLPRVTQALEIAGLSYYTRHARFGELCIGIRAASQGKSSHDDLLIDKLRVDGPHNKLKLVVNYPSILDLTDRELEVMRLFACGKSTREVAERLGLSGSTIDNHKSRMMKKLGIRRTSQLVGIAFRDGLPGLPVSNKSE